MSEEQAKIPSVNEWDDFEGEYLKAESVKEWPVIVVPVQIESEFDEGKAKLSIVFLYKGRERKMGINKTNQNFMRFHNIKAPKDIIGKKLTFTKMKVRNPTTNSMVDSFCLEKIE